MNDYRAVVYISILVNLVACGGGGDTVTPPGPRTSVCPNIVYPAQELSPQVLPYSVGETYKVGQGNCVTPGTGSHFKGSRAEYAYDILMPIGTSLVATQDGIVIYVEESYVDGTGVLGEENTIVIQHADGTISDYGHLTTLGALVDVGDEVRQGDLIAVSGHTGASSEPHVHYEVLACDGDPILFVPVVSFNPSCHSLPMTFRNSRPHPNGLVEGESYTAEQVW